MGKACSTYRRKGYTGILRGNQRERDRLEHSGVDDRIILMDHQEVGCRGMNWIELAQDRDRWRTRVNVVMDLRVP
jgi:hypothetical protein